MSEHEFRPCPSYPYHSVTEYGDVRRDDFPFTTCTGKTRIRAAAMLARTGRHKRYVRLHTGEFALWEDLVKDAWGKEIEKYDVFFPNPNFPPPPSYPDSTIILYSDWLKILQDRQKTG